MRIRIVESLQFGVMMRRYSRMKAAEYSLLFSGVFPAPRQNLL